MNNCCDEHDMCYDTCNKDKELCDIEFKRCLYNYCGQYEQNAVGGDIVVSGCKGAAKMLFTATLTLGCKSYRDAQAKACYCGGPTTTTTPPPPPKNARQQQQQQQGNADYKGKTYNEDSYNRKDGGRANEKTDKPPAYNTYPNNLPQDKRDAPQYGWKDRRDL